MNRKQLDYLMAYIDCLAQVNALRHEMLPYAVMQERMLRLKAALYGTVEEASEPQRVVRSERGEGESDDMSQDY